MLAKKKFDSIKNNKSIALVSPSVKDSFDYSVLRSELKKLGFDKIFDLSLGIKKYNRDLKRYIKSHPEQKIFIASACPAAALHIRKHHPKFAEFLLPIDSPMAAAAKIYKQKYPDYKIFFISPCSAKEKLEAPKYKEFIDGVIAIKHLSLRGVSPRATKQSRDITTVNYSFNGEYFSLFSARGPKNISEILKNFNTYSNSRVFFDILYCENGCKPEPFSIDKNI
jgi:hypothetical protein